MTVLVAFPGSASSDHPSVGAGPFWYMRIVGTMRHPWCLKQEIVRPGYYGKCDATAWFVVGMSTETWVGTDGTMRERTVDAWQRFASPADRAKWRKYRKRPPPPVTVIQGDGLVIGEGRFPPDLFGDNGGYVPPVEGPPAGSGPIDVGDSFFTYRQLLALPDSPTAAAHRIDQAEAALHHRYARTLMRWHSPGANRLVRDYLKPAPRRLRSLQELLLISHLLASPVPQRVRLALFHAATALPGVTVTPDAHDSLGRYGVMVGATYPHWEPVRFIFDPGTGELMTGLPFAGGPPDVAGSGSLVVVQGEVASVTALPAGVKPIRAVSAPPIWPAPPPPRMIALTPTVGRPHTIFSLALAAISGERPRRAPTVSIGITGSGGARCLAPYSGPVKPTRTARTPDGFTYIYRIAPSLIRRHSWCPGRYSLGIQVFPNPIPRRYTTPPYVGPSGTSIYFAVK